MVRLQAMTKAQNYLLHMVSQVPSSESPLNALLTRQNVELINEQTTQTIHDIKERITNLNGRIYRSISALRVLTYREKMLLEETREIQTALKERLSSLRTKSQQTSSQYLAYIASQSVKETLTVVNYPTK